MYIDLFFDSIVETLSLASTWPMCMRFYSKSWSGRPKEWEKRAKTGPLPEEPPPLWRKPRRGSGPPVGGARTGRTRGRCRGTWPSRWGRRRWSPPAESARPSPIPASNPVAVAPPSPRPSRCNGGRRAESKEDREKRRRRSEKKMSSFERKWGDLVAAVECSVEAISACRRSRSGFLGSEGERCCDCGKQALNPSLLWPSCGTRRWGSFNRLTGIRRPVGTRVSFVWLFHLKSLDRYYARSIAYKPTQSYGTYYNVHSNSKAIMLY